jgi:YD repeat-containing protein
MSWKCIVPRGGLAGGVLALVTMLLPSPSQLSAGDISYVYDNLGRVLAVIDPASDTAIYSYDSVGNLTGITRQTSATLIDSAIQTVQWSGRDPRHYLRHRLQRDPGLEHVEV